MDRLTFLLLLLWVGVTVSTEVELQKRIYGGRNCPRTERLYHVALSIRATGNPIHCGGSLIHKQWVLTAAHCNNESLYAVVGVHPGPGRPMIIQDRRIYPNHDIMLLKLPSPVTNINPVPLPNNNDCSTNTTVGEPIRVAGYGAYRINNRIPIRGQPAQLQCATMQVSVCDIILLLNRNESNENWICYSGNNVSTCPGDSGGGVIYNNKLRAVHVGGLSRIRVCWFPSWSLDVCKYLDWINNIAR